MTNDRWSEKASDGYVSPGAIATAAKLESLGWTQHDLDELNDGEQVMIVAAHNGAHGPARYDRFGASCDASGNRKKDVFVLYPDSPYEDGIDYESTMHRPVRNGNVVSRIAIFRPTTEEHLDQMRQLYDARRLQHMHSVAA
jgi:hypothetical protein